jgi:hypothetical protein
MAELEGDGRTLSARKLVLSREILDQLERLAVSVGDRADGSIVYAMCASTSTGNDISCQTVGCDPDDTDGSCLC